MNGAEDNITRADKLIKKGSGVFKYVPNTDNVIVNEVRKLHILKQPPALTTFRWKLGSRNLLETMTLWVAWYLPCCLPWPSVNHSWNRCRLDLFIFIFLTTRPTHIIVWHWRFCGYRGYHWGSYRELRDILCKRGTPRKECRRYRSPSLPRHFSVSSTPSAVWNQFWSGISPYFKVFRIQLTAWNDTRLVPLDAWSLPSYMSNRRILFASEE